MIGLIGAMDLEIEALEAQLQDREDVTIGMDRFAVGKLFGHEAVLAVCGYGKVNAALCAQSMILRFHPEWVLNLGVAGSGEEDVGIGDMVIATAAVQHDMDTSPVGDPVGLISKVNRIELPCDEQLRSHLAATARSIPGIRVHEGVIATGDQFINDGSRRAAIHRLFGAKAIEMEGGAVAHACCMHGVPCGILRSISDSADGTSNMDYMTFKDLAAAHSHQVVQALLKEEAP